MTASPDDQLDPEVETPELELEDLDEEPEPVRTFSPGPGAGKLIPQEILDERPYIKLLVYGNPGVGKTKLTTTAVDHPDMSPAVIFSFEGGLLSVPRETRSRLKKVPIKSISDLENGFWNLVNKQPGWEHFKTAILDSGTEMQTLSLEEIVRAAMAKEAKAGKKERKRKSPDEIFQQDYGKDTARLRRVFRWFRDAPFHTIITALPKFVYAKKRTNNPNEEAKLEAVIPAFTAKLGTSVQGYMDFVWYLFEEKKTRDHYLLTQPQGAFYAKTRGIDFAKKIGQKVSCPIDQPVLADLFSKLLETEMKGTTK